MALRQQIIGRWSSAFGDSTEFRNILSSGDEAFFSGFTVEANQAVRMPAPGTFRNLRVTASTDFPAGDGAVFTFRHGASLGAMADSALAVTLSDTVQSDDNISDSIHVDEDDFVDLKRVTSGSPAGKDYDWSVEWEPDDPDVAVYGYGSGSSNLVANQFEGVFAGGVVWETESLLDIVGVAGQLTEHRVSLATAPGVGTSRTFAAFLDNVAQDGSGGTPDTRVTIADAATTGSATFSLSCAVSQRLSVKNTVSGSPAATRQVGSFAFHSDTPDVWNLSGSLTTPMSGTATLYSQPCGDSANESTTEAGQQFPAPIRSFLISDGRWALDSAPGASKSWDPSFRINGANTAQTCSITGTGAGGLLGSCPGAAVEINSGDLLSMGWVPVNTPANGNGQRWTFGAGPAQIIGSAVFGVTTTVKATRAVAFGLDDATNVHDEAGKLKVFGDFEVTGIATFEGVPVRYAQVAISSAEILALRATPKTLVAAPGAGKIAEFAGLLLLLDATATAYIEVAANLSVKYTNGSGAKVSDDIEATGFIDQTTDTMTTARPKLDAIVAKAGCENQALVLHNLGAAEYITGTGVVRAKIAYRIWSTGW